MESNCIYIPIDVRLLWIKFILNNTHAYSDVCDFKSPQKNNLIIATNRLISYLCEICLAPSSSGRKTGEAKVNL